MSAYAKAQEYRLKKHLEKMYGVKILEYYGSRRKNCGDFLITAPSGTRFRIDHKSTENDTSIRVIYSWLYKVMRENFMCQYRDGTAIPVVTFSLKRHPQIYCFTDIMLQDLKLVTDVEVYNTATPTSRAVTMTVIDLRRLIKAGQGLKVGFQKYVYRLEDFVNCF